MGPCVSRQAAIYWGRTYFNSSRFQVATNMYATGTQMLHLGVVGHVQQRAQRDFGCGGVRALGGVPEAPVPRVHLRVFQ